MKNRILMIVPVLVALARVAVALPPVLSASDTDDNTTVTLRVLDRAIVGDQTSWCEVHVRIVGDSDYYIDTGDVVQVRVFEDDTAGDDLIWSYSEWRDGAWHYDFHPTDAEADAGSHGEVDRTFDCSGWFQDDDYGDYVEVYAQADVDWECCYWDDHAETDNIDVLKVEDDSAEEDDALGQAEAVGLGTTSGRIANDSGDWMSFELTDSFDIDFDVMFDTNAGRLLARIEDGSATTVGTFETTADGSTVSTTLDEGTYYVIVHPHTSTNPNFYDVRLTVTPASCTTGQIQSRDCELCGTQTRECVEGTWGDYGPCEEQGVCESGEIQTEGCERCGTITTTCTDTCQWGTPSACEDQGVCEPREIAQEDCAGGGVRQHECQEDCTWGEWTECGEAFCEGSETRDCYTGPVETRGVGDCHDGTQTCIEGVWSDCDDQQLPTTEICDDTHDNDCDGNTDAADADCGDILSGIGAPCTTDGNCDDEYDCVGAPDDPMFVGGYCGGAECTSDAECGEGVCLDVFAQDYCLRPCTNAGDCRTGYLCIRIQGVKVCVPRCTDDEHCRDTNYSECDLETGRCVESTAVSDPDIVEPVPDAAPDAGVEDPQADPVSPDTTAPDVPTTTDTGGGEVAQEESEACSCATGPGGAWGAMWLSLMLGVLLVTRRRR